MIMLQIFDLTEYASKVGHILSWAGRSENFEFSKFLPFRLDI